MLQMFLNFAQVCSIALTVNAEWTDIMMTTLRSLSTLFVHMPSNDPLSSDFMGAASVETTLSVDCLFSTSSLVPRSISKSIISLLLPFLVLSALAIYWLVTIPNNAAMLKRRLMVSTVIVFYVSYISWVEHLSSALNCVTISDGFTSDLYWTEDTSVRCFQGSHLALISVLVIPMVVLILLGFPTASAIYLYRKRRAGLLEDESVKENFGFMYTVYTEQCVFWECVILIRKAALALVTVFGVSLGGNMQALIAACILIFSLYLQTRYLPYRPVYRSFNSIEIFSLLVCIFTFLSGPFLNDDKISQGGRMLVSLFMVALIASFVVFFVVDLYWKIAAFCRLSLEKDNQSVSERDGGIQVATQWMGHRYKRAVSRLGRAISLD